MLSGENLLFPQEPVASAVFEGYLELESVLEGRVQRLRGQGAIAVCPLSLVWVSAQMGRATQSGGGGLNGTVLGRHVREVVRLDAEGVGVAWRDDSGSGGLLTIRGDDSNGVFAALSEWAALVRVRLAELGHQPGGELV